MQTKITNTITLWTHSPPCFSVEASLGFCTTEFQIIHLAIRCVGFFILCSFCDTDFRKESENECGKLYTVLNHYSAANDPNGCVSDRTDISTVGYVRYPAPGEFWEVEMNFMTCIDAYTSSALYMTDAIHV